MVGLLGRIQGYPPEIEDKLEEERRKKEKE